ncbi:hypothetical protein D3C78_1491280 [compost metagenome]
MSSTTPRRLLDDSRMVFTRSVWWDDRRSWASTSIRPTTPFIGVRISWLMAARKADLARLACSASSRAWVRLAINALRSRMSRRVPMKKRSPCTLYSETLSSRSTA